MKNESLRQVWTYRTNEQTQIVTAWALVGAKNFNWLENCLSSQMKTFKVYEQYDENCPPVNMRKMIIRNFFVCCLSRSLYFAGSNKLKCQFYLPTGPHLTQISTRVANLDDFFNLNNFGQNGQNWKIFVPIIKPTSWRFWGKKSFSDFDLFWPRSGQNCEPTLKSFAPFFGTPNFDTW